MENKKYLDMVDFQYETVTLPISKKSSDYIKTCLNEHILSEDETITNSATFSDGMVMDIKCCGCEDESAYTEAVLFSPTETNGKVGSTLYEVACSDCNSEYLGQWELEYNGKTYSVNIVEK